MKCRPRIGRISLGWAHLIFTVVFGLRLCTLVRLAGSPLFLPLRGDTHFYSDWAQRILRGEINEPFAFYGLPGYAYLLALIYRVFGYNPFVPGLLQAGLDAGVAVMIYRISLKAFAAKQRTALRWFWEFLPQHQAHVIGVIAAFGWALFAPAQAYAIILMPTLWFVFVFWFVVWRIVRPNGLMTNKEVLLVGVIVGLTATAVATVLVLLPLVLAGLVLKLKIDRSFWRILPVRAVLFVAGVSLGTSPCWIHNYFVARDPVFLSAHSGINLWVGNNPKANGYPRFPPGLRAGQAAMLQDSITQAESAAGQPLKRAAVSAYWSTKAKTYIATHFSDWLKLVALKLLNFWSAFQYDDLSIITNLREGGVVFPGLGFGLVAALAIPGMLLAWPIAPQSRWISAAILLSICALLTVFITERYRLAAVPGLLIFAAFGLSILWESISARQFAATALYIILLIASTLFVAWPQRDSSLWALDAYNSGWQALDSNNLGIAEKKLAIAYAYVPDNTETLFALGNLRLAQTNPNDAAAFYHAALAVDPHHKGALNNLGVIAFEAHRYEDAENWFRRAKDVDPGNAKTHFLLAKVLLAEGNKEEARAEAGIAVQLNSEHPEFKALMDKLMVDSPAPR
jgi:Flp pilus assembly protein TadD